MPRLLSSSGGAGGAAAAPAAPVDLIKHYSWYDDGADAVVLLELGAEALAGVPADGVAVAHGADWVEVRVAAGGGGGATRVLRLAGLAAPIAAATAKKGKARVTLRLRKAADAPWGALLAKAGAATGGATGAGAADEEVEGEFDDAAAAAAFAGDDA